jgi:hypothetical protein
MTTSRTIVGPRGTAALQVLQPGVVYGHFSGAMTGEMCDELFAFYEEQMRSAQVVLSFLDASEVRAIDGPFRDRAAAWTRAHPNKNETYVLLRSKMVDMAVSLINLLSGKLALHSFTDRARWTEQATKLGLALPAPPSRSL